MGFFAILPVFTQPMSFWSAAAASAAAAMAATGFALQALLAPPLSAAGQCGEAEQVGGASGLRGFSRRRSRAARRLRVEHLDGSLFGVFSPTPNQGQDPGLMI